MGKKLLSHRQSGVEPEPPSPWYGHGHQLPCPGGRVRAQLRKHVGT